MSYQYLTNTPLDEAVKIYLDALSAQGLNLGDERISTQDALGRVTARAVYARICAPHYNACAMDGIALDARITFGATETTPVRLKSSDFTWVDTGDPLPAGCDSVIMVEDVVEEGDTIILYSAATPWQHIRQIGEDISAGDMILPSFTIITPAGMGAMLAGGILQIEVLKKPVIGIIPTGDEIVLPTDNPAEGEVIEFNSTIFSGMLSDWGYTPKVYPIAADKPEELHRVLEIASGECDGVIINAGSSAGREDFTAAAIRSVGEVVLHGVGIKPGKPAVLGMVKAPHKDGVIPVIGLPGYPVSGIIVMELVFKPVLNALTKQRTETPAIVEAVLSRRLNSSLKYREFIRTRLGLVSGKLVAVPLSRGAGVVSSFVKADGIIDIPQEREGYEAGESVQVRLTHSMEEIHSMLVVTGSHDPLLDEVADLMRHRWPGSLVGSSHVGSMGGIMALRRSEAHLGGIHLLDEDSGTYNIPYVQKYFPQGGVVLVECVQRTQGLMVAGGNPKNIRGFADIAELEFVNRQKGSGTRILFDHLAGQVGINLASLRGYNREEFTHTAVAAAIAAGTADAGLGILAAARIYDLDFIPVADEQYDLLIAEEALELETVQQFLEILQSQAFATRLEKLGGYTLTHPGRIIKWH
ncbi:MAG TPA: molybdopterin biosynthesis protein [Brevefilum sp.]|nr:molybdopterin biosynthesis protein [Brevefilum sp.]HOR19538.1 molybdopterin biosynthesis protein [Brevefilum sp.]HPL68748.1 molybdopterin biosynthesis protein [Brevefilum sp.]